MSVFGFRFDNTYNCLPDNLFSVEAPESVKAPELVILNKALASQMGLDFSGSDEKALAEMFGGNTMPDGAEPLAQAYAGHQFGHFNILGDGRAILWGEHLGPDERRYDIQYKGSGRTPYSRRGDGRASLGPMLREYIISEAMHALGIPTTRSLAVVTTGEKVYRQTPLPGAILTRVAASHIRVGTFEYTAYQREPKLVQTLVDYTIQRHYPELQEAENRALALFKAVSERQAELMTHWMRVGFIHGVMNTDNALLSGETIDYGPCAFMDPYAPDTVFSSIDYEGRYAYKNQPLIAQWNLARLVETLIQLFHEDLDTAIEMAQKGVEEFGPLYQQKWLSMMRKKLGLFGEEDEDKALVEELLEWMHQNRADYTNTFRALKTELLPDGIEFQTAAFQKWHTQWDKRRKRHNGDLQASLELMRVNNPAVIPRNHKVEQALNAASDKGDFQPLHALLEALERPYEERPELAPFQLPPLPEERVCQTFCGT